MTIAKSLLLNSKPGILHIAGLVLFLTAAGGHAQSRQSDADKAALAQLPPLEPAIVAMVETNSAGPIENRIYTITHADITSTQKAQALFLMFKGLKPEDQRKVAITAASFTDDTSYVLVHEHLVDPNLQPEVLSVLMTHTLKREDSVRLPVLLELAQINRHPLRDEARQLLRALLKTNYGTDWKKWEQSVKTTLASRQE